MCLAKEIMVIFALIQMNCWHSCLHSGDRCMCLPGSIFCTKFHPISLLPGLSNSVDFALLNTQQYNPVKMGFALPAFLSIEMTSPIISVKNATTEYSGTYSCTVTNRVGSDQCLLRLDVVPRKYLFFCCDNICFP